MPAHGTDRVGSVTVFCADRGGYIGFGIIFVMFGGMMGWIVTKDPRPATVTLMASIIVAAGTTLVWLRAFRIEITPTAVVYRSLAVRRTVNRRDIRAVSSSVEPLASPWGPTVRLTLTIAHEPPLVINAKVFSRDAARALGELVPASRSPT